MGMEATIRFRVPPKLRRRAEKVVALRNAGRVNKETISDLGRDYFISRLLAEERELGIAPAEAKAA